MVIIVVIQVVQVAIVVEEVIVIPSVQKYLVLEVHHITAHQVGLLIPDQAVV
jgi:hypothetical protein